MSVSSEVQRTLVKSPPELWAELSNPNALTRHLGELGDIRITNIEPETKVEWEADDASGVVQLKPSGWGTKVTLSVTRNPPSPEEPVEPEPVAEVESEPTPEPVAVAETNPPATPEPMTDVEVEPDPSPEPIAATHPEPLAEAPKPETIVQPEPKPTFFARLFRKRRPKPVAVAEPEPEPIAAAEPDTEVVAMAAPEPIYPEPPPEPVVDLAAELASVEAQMTEETTELLTGVLDRLGAAHHRPFSRG